jgi:hypothetical protein
MALNAAAAEVVCMQHPKFAALTVREFSPDHVNEEHKLVRTFAGLAAPFRSSWHRDTRVPLTVLSPDLNGGAQGPVT